MPNTNQEIIDAFKEHIGNGGGGYGAWYVGVSKDARDRLFNGHQVKESGDWWIYRQAVSAQAARNIEDYFVTTLRASGGPGGGDQTADMVYAYKKAPHTNP